MVQSELEILRTNGLVSQDLGGPVYVELSVSSGNTKGIWSGLQTTFVKPQGVNRVIKPRLVGVHSARRCLPSLPHVQL